MWAHVIFNPTVPTEDMSKTRASSRPARWNRSMILCRCFMLWCPFNVSTLTPAARSTLIQNTIEFKLIRNDKWTYSQNDLIIRREGRIDNDFVRRTVLPSSELEVIHWTELVCIRPLRVLGTVHLESHGTAEWSVLVAHKMVHEESSQGVELGGRVLQEVGPVGGDVPAVSRAEGRRMSQATALSKVEMLWKCEREQ